VRAGEHLLLHETQTGSSTVSLAATALERGACGDRVRARIEVTGALTEITVLGHGMGALSRKEDRWR
jgi:flagella basal body P-ring formation protein FlgA